MILGFISEGDVDRGEHYRRFPGDNMERYHPRAGLWCIVVALPTWIVFLINGMLGFFPAVIFAEGGVDQKFHFWLFLKDRFFGGSVDPVWSDAGAMTSQEWLLLGLALPSTLGALYCLRRRPEFGAIERKNEVDERETLEMGSSSFVSTGGGDAHTQSIVESVIGQKQTLDQNVVSAALGEMGVIAAANAAEEEEQPEKVEVETILDSRFTTTVQDDDVLDMISAYVEEGTDSVEETESVDEDTEDDIGWGVWNPEDEPETEAEIDTGAARELPEIPEIFREPVVETPDPLTIPSIPEIPVIETPNPNLGERISTIATQAADATVNVTKDVVNATVSGAKEVVSIAAGITEKVVGKVRQKSTKGVMPVRPPGLPTMAEWDAYQGAWTIMGRPVHVVAQPEPESPTPDWTHSETHPTDTVSEIIVEQKAESGGRRNTPFIPELP